MGTCRIREAQARSALVSGNPGGGRDLLASGHAVFLHPAMVTQGMTVNLSIVHVTPSLIPLTYPACKQSNRADERFLMTRLTVGHGRLFASDHPPRS